MTTATSAIAPRSTPAVRKNLQIVSAKAFTDEDSKLLAAIPNAKHGLLQGMKQLRTSHHIPVQAKLELDDSGALSLSIYTTKAGEKTIPEKNGVVESFGDPTQGTWTPGKEDFDTKADDKAEHAKRSASFLTLMQLTHTTLEDVVRDVALRGIVYRVEPEILNGRPVFNVLVLKADGTAEQLKVAMPMQF